MKLNKDQQWKTVIDALAVALVAIDSPEIRGLRSTIELDFNAAWRDWPQATDYTSVDPNDFYIYAMKSGRRSGAHGAFNWDGELRAQLVGGTDWWAPEEVLDLVAENSRTSAEAWRALARNFASKARDSRAQR